ncbi:MAG: acyloxyacyl hydrolase [Haliscomenobacter sp.]|uniref:acyloxyacyl hydrolase n=1 Tax=Haliscomenobacter sp. TaxID=2717303 RepID=UPI0029BF0A5A|nr:acyloxyacyl hydrolase [Haliscomenobacter sp.]MDX2069559.1 acyloxyacyl hydrolase [Haliscomenobacter sp.]
MKIFYWVLWCCLFGSNLNAQFPPFTKWYENPLGFEPLNLHTVNGIIVPAAVASAVLLLSKNNQANLQRLSWYEDLGVSFGYYGSKTTIYQSNTGFLFVARSFMSLGAEVSSYYTNDEVNHTWGFGLRPFVRFYPVKGERFKLFFQSGAGLMYFLEEYPQPSGFFGDNRMGTRLNGTPKYGIGSVFQLSPWLQGQAAFWHVHVSNGNHPSAERNPGHDSNGFSLSLIYQKHK